MMRTSEVAAQAAVNAQTLRYYERLRLLAEPSRTAGGYRAYPPEAVRRVRFIKIADLERRIADLEALRRDDQVGCALFWPVDALAAGLTARWVPSLTPRGGSAR